MFINIRSNSARLKCVSRDNYGEKLVVCANKRKGEKEKENRHNGRISSPLELAFLRLLSSRCTIASTMACATDGYTDVSSIDSSPATNEIKQTRCYTDNEIEIGKI